MMQNTYMIILTCCLRGAKLENLLNFGPEVVITTRAQQHRYRALKPLMRTTVYSILLCFSLSAMQAACMPSALQQLITHNTPAVLTHGSWHDSLDSQIP
jgi:hypothetical protein